MPIGVLPPLLRTNPNRRRFFIGQSVSLLGDQITAIALPLTAVLALHASAGQIGALTTAYLVPNLLLSLHAGASVDRRGRRREVMLATDVGRALLIGSVPVAYAFGHLTWTQLYVVAFLTGSLSVFFYVAYGAMIQMLVPARGTCRRIRVHGSRAFSFLAGNSVGGSPRATTARPVRARRRCVLVSLAALFLKRMGLGEPPGAPPEAGSLMAGARWIRANAVVRAELLGVATLNFFNFIFFALFVLYATRHLHVSPAALGLVLGAGSVGTLGGSFITARIGRRIGVGRTFTLGCFSSPHRSSSSRSRQGRTGSCSCCSSSRSSRRESA